MRFLKLVFALLGVLFSCCVKAQINYANIGNWASHPHKKDVGDSVPKPLFNTIAADSTVDIFFIHPTTYTNVEQQFGFNGNIDDESLNNKTDFSTILYQASIFNAAGRLFAPRYRQAHYSCYFPKNLQDSINAKAAFDTAYNDIKTAFVYYLNNVNGGRPIVIASHSQGTTHAKRLLKEFFDGKTLQNKLVVAYLVGMPVAYNWFTNIPDCKKPYQTGCVCSWRTYKEDYTSSFIDAEKDSAIVTNPLTWDAEKPYASIKENKGSILKKFNKVLPQITNAQVVKGILWAKKPKFFGNIFLVSKNYHIADYNFFYVSIRENVTLRIKAFWKQ